MLELINPVRSPLFAPKLGRAQYVHIGRESVHNIGMNPIFLILLSAEKCVQYDTLLYLLTILEFVPLASGAQYLKGKEDLNHSRAFSHYF